MKKPDGGPAYPTHKRITENYMDAAGYGRSRDLSVLVGGLTIRDYFAAQALQAIIISRGHTEDRGWPTYAEVDAYRLADAMIAERNKS
jgi:hypothetical protein